MGNGGTSPLGDVGSRYRIIGSLGKGGGGETFEAIRIADEARVALKCLVVAQTRDWKTVELFEREARVLASLTHPAIPRYEDSFVVESEQGTSLYLVHQFAPGVSLRQWLERGWHPDEAEIFRITEFLLDVLSYLHTLAPPVVHRDIKPDNIIRSEDGRLWLVDFGAVRDFTSTMSGGSTVVGTYGYMAPEQFRGQAIPASDIYGVAATLLFLLTGRPPTELPQEKLKVVFRPYVQTISPKLVAWLDRALEPAPEDRFPTAAIALQALRSAPVAQPAPARPSRKRLGILLGTLVAVIAGAVVVVGVTEAREKRAKAELARRMRGSTQQLPHRPDGSVVIVHPQRVFQGHMALILSIAISPDDKTLATGSDGSVKLWDMQTGEVTRTLGGIDGRVGSLAFSKDGARLVTGGGTTLRIWDVAAATVLKTIEHAHDKEILELAMAPDGKTFVTVARDGKAKTWDFESGRELRAVVHGSSIFSVAISPDSAHFVTGAADGTVKTWALASGILVQTVPAQRATINAIAYSPDGAMVATASDDHTVKGWRVDRSGTLEARYTVTHRDEVWGAAFSPDGRFLATATKDGTTHMIEPFNGGVLSTEFTGGSASKVGFTRDSRTMVSIAGAYARRYSVTYRRSGTKLPEPSVDGPLVRPTHGRDEELFVEAMRLMMNWRIKEAEAKLDEEMKLNASSPLAWIGQARLALSRAYIDGYAYEPKGVAVAQQHLEHAATLGPKSADWWSVRAWVARAQKDSTSARDAVRQAYALVPQEPYAALAEAKITMDDERYPEAVAMLAQVIGRTRRPEILSWAYSELRECHEKLGDLDAVEANWRRSLDINPQSARNHADYAWFLFRSVGDVNRAMAEAETSLALSDSPSARRTIVAARCERANRLLWENRDPDGALKEYEAALVTLPKSAMALYGRAAVYRFRALTRHDPSLVRLARADLELILKVQREDDYWRPDTTDALSELDTVEVMARAK